MDKSENTRFIHTSLTVCVCIGICCWVGSRGGVAKDETAEITGREEGNTPGNLA